jgi:thiamine monophosphate synthase
MTEGRIIGVSTHSLQEAQRLIIEVAEAPEGYRPDYMSFGPIFPTVARRSPIPRLGQNCFKELLAKPQSPWSPSGVSFRKINVKS